MQPAQPESDREPVPASKAGVSLVIPAYNEGRGIAPVLEELFTVIDALDGIPVEVIVVDDGSTDETTAVANGYSDPRLRVITHETNRGYGASIKTGMRAAVHDWICITDADGTYPPKFFGELLSHRDTNDMVVGARIGETAKIPLIRRPPKWVLRKLASYLSQVDIPDLNSGFRVMRKSLVERYEHILPNQFSLTTTITLALLSAGYSVKYIPIDYLKREGRSKIRPIADTLKFLSLIVRTVMLFNPLRVFLPLALLFIVGAIGVGVGSYTIAGQLADVTTLLLFVTGVQVLALGMLADVINSRAS